MTYPDGETIEMGDLVEYNDEPERFEPEEAVVLKIGKGKLHLEYTNTAIPRRKFWGKPEHCQMIRREC